MNKSIVLLLLVVGLAFGCKSKEKIVRNNNPKTEVTTSFAFDFQKSSSITDVLDKAAKEEKLVFLDIYTTWCLPCKMMDRDVFTHQPTADIINENFISYKVNAEKDNGPDLNLIYNVQSYPTLLFLDTKGRVLVQKSGAAYHSELLAMAERSLAISKT